MDDTLNPYTPGSGVTPAVLSGREKDMETFGNLIKRTQAGLMGRPVLMTGLRGVGKTVLLNQFRFAAEEAGWLCIKIEASRGKRGSEAARKALVAGLARASLRYKTRALGKESARVVTQLAASFSASMGIGALDVGLDIDNGGARSTMTGNLEIDLQDVVVGIANKIYEERTALAIFIDEMQDLDEELREALISAQHESSQRAVPFYIVGAGLPSLPGLVAETRSYAERMFEVIEVGRLTAHSTALALQEPAALQGAEIAEDAVELIVSESGGYPYFIQEFGAHLWRVATSSPFSVEAAAQAVRLGIAQLDRGFFQARWDRATPSEREYLAAMASSEGTGLKASISTAEISRALGKDTRQLGPIRAKLISKGLIYATEHGMVAYTVPNFSNFIARQADQSV